MSAIPTPTTPAQEVVVAFFEACVERNLGVMRKLYRDDAEFTFWGDFECSGTFRGIEEVFAGYFEPAGKLAIPGHSAWEWGALIGDEDVVVAQYTYFNKALSGEQYVNDYAQVFTIRDGQIAVVRHYCDTQKVKDVLLPDAPVAV